MDKIILNQWIQLHSRNKDATIRVPVLHEAYIYYVRI
jgi:hypothetical protein